MIDAHCHLSFPDFDSNRDAIAKDSMASMDAVIDSAPSVQDAVKSTALAKNYPGFIFSCIGLHPDEIPKLSDQQISDHMDFIRSCRENVVAVGEVGIDNFHVTNSADRERCKKVFVRFIELADELGKPLVIHAREDNGEAVAILEEHGAKNVILHCFGSPQLVGTVSENNWFASIPTLVVRSKKHQRLVQALPLDAILTETDSPFLSPAKGETNVPKNVKAVVDAIASKRNISFSEADRATTRNAIRAFGLPIRP